MGCGDGALISRLARIAPGTVPFGVDIEPDVIGHARLYLEDLGGTAYLGNICNASGRWLQDRQYQLVLIMAGVLLEMSAREREVLLLTLKSRSKMVLYYLYNTYASRCPDYCHPHAGIGRRMV